MTLVVHVPFIDVFAGPRRDLERVTQARMGENLAEVETQGSYSLVECEDGYRGWIDREGVTDIGSDYYARSHDVLAIMEPFVPISSDPDHFDPFTIATMGSRLAFAANERGKQRILLPNQKIGYVIACEVRPADNPFPTRGAKGVVRTSLRLRGVPYLWGGTTPWGLDCSGFVQLVFRVNGYSVKRDAQIQYDTAGKIVAPGDITTGDLLFFKKGSETKVSHVAIYLGSDKIIHSSGRAGKVLVEYLEALRQILVGARRVIQ